MYMYTHVSVFARNVLLYVLWILLAAKPGNYEFPYSDALAGTETREHCIALMDCSTHVRIPTAFVPII